ncbi:unnamed protein product [Camellia sinensis]
MAKRLGRGLLEVGEWRGRVERLGKEVVEDKRVVREGCGVGKGLLEVREWKPGWYIETRKRGWEKRLDGTSLMRTNAELTSGNSMTALGYGDTSKRVPKERAGVSQAPDSLGLGRSEIVEINSPRGKKNNEHKDNNLQYDMKDLENPWIGEILKEENSLELIMSSYQLLNELDKAWGGKKAKGLEKRSKGSKNMSGLRTNRTLQQYKKRERGKLVHAYSSEDLGGILKADDIEPFMIWGYYISPVMYGQNALVINEFLDKRWSARFSQLYGEILEENGIDLAEMKVLRRKMEEIAIVVNQEDFQGNKLTGQIPDEIGNCVSLMLVDLSDNLLDKIKDSNRQSKQLEELTGRMRECKRDECKCNPVRYFAIISTQRSGSGWFETLLNSHINISSNGEIFSVKVRRSNISTIVETLDKIYNLDWLTSASKNECTAAVGLKWMLNQGLMQHHEEIVEYFNTKGVSLIFLFRRNLLRRMISILSNSYDQNAKPLNGTHKSHVHSSHEAEILASYKPTIDTTLLIPNLRQVEEMTAKALEYFKSTQHIILYYEDIIKNSTKLKDVQDFLRVPQRDLKSQQVKIHKGSLSQHVENWDDIQRALYGTPYESFLHSDYNM